MDTHHGCPGTTVESRANRQVAQLLRSGELARRPEKEEAFPKSRKKQGSGTEEAMFVAEHGWKLDLRVVTGFGKVCVHLWRVERFSMSSAAGRTEVLSCQGLVGSKD